MSKPKFTPGPWEAERVKSSFPNTEVSSIWANGMNIADFYLGHIGTVEISREEYEANVRLAKAAPEMYDLIRSVANTHSMDELSSAIIEAQTLIYGIDGI